MRESICPGGLRRLLHIPMHLLLQMPKCDMFSPHTHTHTHTYIYIYIHTQRQKHRKRTPSHICNKLVHDFSGNRARVSEGWCFMLLPVFVFTLSLTDETCTLCVDCPGFFHESTLSCPCPISVMLHLTMPLSLFLPRTSLSLSLFLSLSLSLPLSLSLTHTHTHTETQTQTHTKTET